MVYCPHIIINANLICLGLFAGDPDKCFLKDFPEGYKLFAVIVGGRTDHYLCGMSSEFFTIMMLNRLYFVVRLYYKEVSLFSGVSSPSSVAHEGYANYKGTTFNL